MKPNRDSTRLLIISATFGMILLAFVFRLSSIQIVKGDYYLSLQSKGHIRTQSIKAARGEITDRNGNPFTYNTPSYNIVFDKALDPGTSTNETINKLISLMTNASQPWRDTLPLSKTFPLRWDGPQRDIDYLKGKSFLNLNDYATADEVFYWLQIRYGVIANPDKASDKEKEFVKYTDEDARQICGVRYMMEKESYTVSNKYVFATNISLETAAIIRQENFDMPGVYVMETANRAYSDGTLAPHIIGRTGMIFAEEMEHYLSLNRGYTPADYVGKEGIEKAFETYLRGADGIKSVQLDARYNVTEIEVSKEAVAGNTVVLTIDKMLQKVAYSALEKQILNLQETAPEGQGKEADSGAVVAVDIKTGEILAAVSYPTYNMETYSQDFNDNNSNPLSPFINRAFQGIYAPGSCFKPVTALAGLTESVNTEDTIITCTGVYTGLSGGYNPTCLSVHGAFSVVDALRHSCNIFFYDTGARLGIQKINDYAQMLGLGVPAGIELYEAKGSQSDPNSKNPGDAVQTAIGQLGNGYTPLQLANYTATLAQNGAKRDLTLIKSVSSYYDYTKSVMTLPERPITKSTIPAEYFEIVREGMVQATHDPRGTAYRYLGDYPIKIASKTGTPQTASFPNSTFICYAPADDPQIAIAVMIEKGWHGYTGAPVARAILDAFFFPETLEPIEENGEIADESSNAPEAVSSDTSSISQPVAVQ